MYYFGCTDKVRQRELGNRMKGILQTFLLFLGVINAWKLQRWARHTQVQSKVIQEMKVALLSTSFFLLAPTVAIHDGLPNLASPVSHVLAAETSAFVGRDK